PAMFHACELYFSIFFFFQAEDGIRDLIVTGVQTCALPICSGSACRPVSTFQIPSIIQTSKQVGMLTLNDALLELVEKKEISPDEAYMKSVEKAGLVSSLKARGHKVSFTA